MTKLLVSVTNVEEAQLALENGADMIDLKDPAQGALGALPIEIIRQITDYVHTKDSIETRYVSATIGDLPMQTALVYQRVLEVASAKPDIVKIGFFEADDYQPCLDALKSLADSKVKLIAVLFAEYEYPDNLIAAIADAGFYGLMIDTAHKNGETFMRYIPDEKMKALSSQIIERGLVFGLAGSLKVEHVAKVKQYNPGYMGFRGGVSTQLQRNMPLDGEKLRQCRHEIRR
ncbi:MAG: hypothetical protein FJY53_04410 [Betaproteobacteria bacterium]|nr:hypothetical protein [Betaproteobacteria bacterium]